MLTRDRGFLGQFHYDLPQFRFPKRLKRPGQSVDYLVITAFRTSIIKTTNDLLTCNNGIIVSTNWSSPLAAALSHSRVMSIASSFSTQARK